MADDDLVPCRDYDVCLDTGVYAFTVWPDDDVHINAYGDMEFTFRQRVPGRDKDEEIILHGPHIRWYSIRRDARKMPTALDHEKLKKLGLVDA